MLRDKQCRTMQNGSPQTQNGTLLPTLHTLSTCCVLPVALVAEHKYCPGAGHWTCFALCVQTHGET
jgi:hypothetical protein